MYNEQLNGVLLEEDNPKMNNTRVGFGRRLGAYLLDILIVMVVGSFVGAFVGNELTQIFFQDQMEQYDLMAGQFDNLGFDFIGFMTKFLEIMAGVSITGLSLFIVEGAFGQSFGKMILKIVNTNVDGTKADASKLWLRSFLKYASSLVSLIGSVLGLAFISGIASLWGFVIFIGFFLVFMENKQTIHDMIAKTVVSRK
jgi:uncharacterized RDD family membrane protein YckC